ncbi:MAG: hypothetical protein HYV97_19460 [Bdellovibrio sp.]|nr:hypothetical protein [Bdellovibrio sp.]
MKSDIRLKLFCISFCMIGLTLFGVKFHVNRTFEKAIDNQAEEELSRILRIFKNNLLLLQQDFPEISSHALAHRLAGGSSDLRVTILAQDGNILGDSSFSLQSSLPKENHRHRREVMGALLNGKGIAKRVDHTYKVDFMYMATPFSDKKGDQKILRVAMPIDGLVALHADIHFSTMTVGLFALIITGGIIALTFHYMFNPMWKILSSRGQKSLLLPRSNISSGNLAERLESATKELKEESDLLNAVLSDIDNGVIAIDTDDKITLCNQAARDILDCQDCVPIEKGLISPSSHPCIRKVIDCGKKEDKGTDRELILDSGKVISIKAGYLGASNSRGMVFVIHDVTEVRQLESMRKNLIANVSHELRTPLSTMRSSAEILLAGALSDPEQTKRFVTAIMRNITLLSGIVEDLLDLSSIDAGEYQLELQTISVLVAGYRAFEHVGIAAKNKSMVLEIQIPEGTEILADEQAFDQVLFNLMTNAVKYTPENGHIKLQARLEGDMVRIEVVDNGPGIAPEFRLKIFERFFRVDAARSRDSGGTGLGLAIVKDLVEKMNGKVWVECPEPSGSSFCMTFPRAV